MNLNVEQKKLIQAKPTGHNLIKGVAGSGKTTVAVHRIPFLLKHYCFEKNDSILMVTFNKTLINYITHLYKKVENTEQVSFGDFLTSKENKVDIKTIDKIIYSCFQKFKKETNYQYNITTDNKIIAPTLKQSAFQLRKKYPEEDILDERNLQFLKDEIDWIKSCNYMELEEYQNIDRIGRTNQLNPQGPQKLRKNSDKRRIIFELMQLYSEKLKKQGYIDFKDMSLLALDYAKNHSINKYTHILIDESQDLTRVQIEVLKAMYQQKEYSSIAFIADTAQNIYPHSWLVKGRSFASMGFDMKGKSNILAKNYRTTTQVAECAYSLIEKDPNIVEDENYVKASLIDRQGSYPVYRFFSTQGEEAAYVIREIKENLLEKYALKDITIIAKNKIILDYMSSKLEEANLNCVKINKMDGDFDTDSIKFVTLHSIKGLEFKVVFIVGLNEGVIPYLSYKDEAEKEYQESIERKLLYVGMTRANELLYMTSSKAPSKFIKDINGKFLKIKAKSEMHICKNIHIDSYIFKEKVADIYSKEEKIRQWILKQLIETYKYPLSLIDIEYRINSFSKTGFVDAVVNIYKNNTKVPYIFVETKAFNQGTNDALEQLKSYMSNSKDCQYGIATDGSEIKIINKDFEEIDDIPMFDTTMLPISLKEYEYVDLKHNRKIKIIKDSSLPKDLTIKDENDSINYSEADLRAVAVYGNIAAGYPIYMNEEIEGKLSLPQEWFNSSEEYFVLKVKGDSMIDTGINNGDYVLIKAQNTAENRDIVAAADGESATLKRFTQMGDTVILMPENKNYEPIMLKSDEVRIMGIAVGVMKESQ
ncbi:transcriptional repressor LexA [Clostridium sp. ZS2-4]|uniref:transcriptional repressor LexA n=1 Tax=Clostridium sp. ZS2-4 TaxID=2987703 RepID=UPI00227B1EC0|nr:transcriptional repressor LexA [Clostridium sp. ZS2-4]MCY6354175.1 transcriptional repressor LexA [Clostridium sp. ZS2-4]